MPSPLPGSAAYNARYGKKEPELQPKLKDLAELLEENGIESILSKLDGDTLESLESQLTSDRVGFLNGLKEKGVGNLVERQKLANAIGKAKRLDRF